MRRYFFIAVAVLHPLVFSTSQPANAEPWSYGAGGLCTSKNTFFGDTPEAVAEQYTAALKQCDPASYREIFLYCEDPRPLGGSGATTTCYTHRTLVHDPDVYLQYGVSRRCSAGRTIDSHFDCICPKGTLDNDGQCVNRCPRNKSVQGGKCLTTKGRKGRRPAPSR